MDSISTAITSENYIDDGERNKVVESSSLLNDGEEEVDEIDSTSLNVEPPSQECCNISCTLDASRLQHFCSKTNKRCHTFCFFPGILNICIVQHNRFYSP